MISKNKKRIPEQNVLDAFFVLLRAGLWGTTPDPALFVDMGRKEWVALLQMAQKQAVLGLVYAGISRLPKELMPESQVLLRLYGFVEQIRKQNARIDEVTQEICSWLEAEGLEPIVLKGRSIGAIYVEPNLRQSGDIDLFFHRDYERVVPILTQRGVKVILDNNHDTFTYRGILVELHNKPFRPLYPLYNLDLSPIRTDLTDLRVLNVKANMLLLLLHPAIHFMEVGIGIRHLCDWAVFVHHYAGTPELNEAWMLLEKQGIGVFCREFTALAQILLKIDLREHSFWTANSDLKLRNRMLDEILRMGNFGHWVLPKKWDFGNWVVYGFKKVQYAVRVYSFCPKWFWLRFPRRFKKMIFRETNRMLKG